MEPDNLIPVTIIGGYLGAGKTTLVNHLLRNANGKRLAILVNEFGALPIDGDLIESQDDNIINLAGGCVCCSYGNDLILAMMDMARMQPRPDHVILEASGVAIPAMIAGSVSLLDGFVLDGIVVLADAETVMERAQEKYMGDTVQRQFEEADLILLNKIDLVEDHQQSKARNWLQEGFTNSTLIETRNCVVPNEVILQTFETTTQKGLANTSHKLNQFESREIRADNIRDGDALAQSIIESHRNIVRAKGFFRSRDGEMKTLQLVGKRWQITPAPDDVAPAMVVIGTRPINTDNLI